METVFSAKSAWMTANATMEYCVLAQNNTALQQGMVFSTRSISSFYEQEKFAVAFINQEIEMKHPEVLLIYFMLGWSEARGNVVVKALCYKLEGRGFETR
jgi:hypothetical protein